ncbi:MAG: hypothetical protein C4334_15165 [Pyrinomonas sp.]|uniref:fibronectin type III domain-containing protein n=1 Tax=Pyrinomonas sp. TaxID=2080306 RepID=UPI003318C4C6
MTRTRFAPLLIASALLLSACGKRRPPLPPVQRAPQRTELLSGVQQGPQVILSWPAPRSPLQRIDIYRLVEPLDAPLPLTEEEFAARASIIGYLSADQLARAGQTITYTDPLRLTPRPVRLRYAIRYVNRAGQPGPFSNFLLLEPASRVPMPPTISDVVQSEQAITIRWTAPTANVDGSAPANLLGYNIYRSSNAEPALQPLNQQLLTTTSFVDRNFRFGEDYTYVVRAVTADSQGNQVESLNSNAVRVSPRDIYPPSAPTAVTIAAAPGRISIFFPANPERDVVAYQIYRALDPSLPKERWTKLARITRTTFQDENVVAGVRYYYYVTAIDAAGNESPPSEVVSEVAP